jgi:hypothetical protein
MHKILSVSKEGAARGARNSKYDGKIAGYLDMDRLIRLSTLWLFCV